MWRKSSAGRIVEVMAAIGLGEFARERGRDHPSRRLLFSRLDAIRLFHTWLCSSRGGRSASQLNYSLAGGLNVETGLSGKRHANYRSDHRVRPS